MASIRKEIGVKLGPDEVWSVLADVGAVHTRLARGLVTATTLEGNERVVTFSNGQVARERIVTVDGAARRLVYAVVGGRFAHHSASFEVCDGPAGTTTLVWLADVWPDDQATGLDVMMELGVQAIERTLGPRERVAPEVPCTGQVR